MIVAQLKYAKMVADNALKSTLSILLFTWIINYWLDVCIQCGKLWLVVLVFAAQENEELIFGENVIKNESIVFSYQLVFIDTRCVLNDININT